MCTITSNEQEKTEAHAAAGMPASDKVESHNALFQSLALHAMLAMLFPRMSMCAAQVCSYAYNPNRGCLSGGAGYDVREVYLRMTSLPRFTNIPYGVDIDGNAAVADERFQYTKI